MIVRQGDEYLDRALKRREICRRGDDEFPLEGWVPCKRRWRLPRGGVDAAEHIAPDAEPPRRSPALRPHGPIQSQQPSPPSLPRRARGPTERFPGWATTCLQAVLTLKTVQQWLGHMDLASIMRYLRAARGEGVRAKVEAVWTSVNG
jgi:hypothetical protein